MGLYCLPTWYAMRVSSLCNCMVVAVAIPVCKKKEDRQCWSLSSKQRGIESLKLGHLNWACTACLPGMLCGLVVYVTAWSSLVAIPVCKKRGQTMHCSPAAIVGAPRAASPPLQGLVNHDPFIEGVLSEGSEVMGHCTPS